MTLLNNFSTLAGLVFCLGCISVFYQLLLSPLRNVPGPRLAAISSIWLWFQDMAGNSPQMISKLHKRHGPIVRIGPNEVSIDDIEIHNRVLYCQAPKYMKAAYFYDPFKTGPSGIFQSSEPKEHSTLRRLVSKPFSRKSILQFEPEIWKSVDMLSDVLCQHDKDNNCFDLSKMSRCLSLDFITNFTYGESMQAVLSPRFHDDVLDAFDSFAVSNFLFMMIPSLRQPSIALLSILPFKVFQAIPRMRLRVQKALERYDTTGKINHDTGFQPLLQAEHAASITQNYPLSKDFLIADGLADIFAGTDTTSTTLTLTLNEIFSNSMVYGRLHAELKRAIPNLSDTAELSNLESLPYLAACVKEGLRFSTPVRSRLPRVTPESGLTYGKHLIPSGTFISSSPYLMNYNQVVFPDPYTYKPERWLLDDPEAVKQLDNCWAPFSKGSRGCIGINLAMAEIYITIAAIVRRFELVEKNFEELKIREIFGVIFDEPLAMKLKSVQE
ncbi:hypothetical protein N7510_002715 [Penicillium lagena]|uniref:uncharacterized protein n=1 Tax=Penicillium lagena TaxID=94218 RepID=UPI0025423C1D|nr:uncharacterized protein N7510_002715 [Penicillium lagena]KAJ5626406.1 hypothetical protein N7510_002715 [Penicillium lagena]